MFQCPGKEWKRKKRERRINRTFRLKKGKGAKERRKIQEESPICGANLDFLLLSNLRDFPGIEAQIFECPTCKVVCIKMFKDGVCYSTDYKDIWSPLERYKEKNGLSVDPSGSGEDAP